MMKKEEMIAMRAIALCFKPYLKPEEALIYCNLGRTQFAKKCEEFSVYKNNNGYYKKTDIDRMPDGKSSSDSGNILQIEPMEKTALKVR